MWKVNNSGMRGLTDFDRSMPAFLNKLWKLVDDPVTDKWICWNENGASFIIIDQVQFAKELLPLYFKHNNMASFIRQLNMYGFHKLTSLDSGSLKSENNEMEFAHQYFIKDHPYLLENIKRKLSASKQTSVVAKDDDISGGLNEILSKFLPELHNIKSRQEEWDSKLIAMKKENETLWRELARSRQSLTKQSHAIGVLFRLLCQLLQQSHNVRRRFPLMINDTPPVRKITKAVADMSSEGSPTGPTIHELDPGDVLYSASEPSQSTSTGAEYISSDLTEPYVEVMSPESSHCASTEMIPKDKPMELPTESPENWLNIELAEDDGMVPINPIKVNPSVAAASLRDLANEPIAITIPSIPVTDNRGKKSTTAKKTIYLPEIPKDGNRKRIKKPATTSKKSNQRTVSDQDLVEPPEDASPEDLFMALVSSNRESKVPNYTKPAPVGAKRKFPKAAVGAADACRTATSSNLNSNASVKLDDIPNLRSAASTNPSQVANPNVTNFDKLESLYNGTIDASQLSLDSPVKNLEPAKESLKEELKSLELALSPEINLDDLVSNPSPTSSLAIVCPPSGKSKNGEVSRQLNSHIEKVQEDIDLLTDYLQAENGYTFDASTLKGLFPEDLLAFNMHPAPESGEKENVAGNELITYNSPNIMDLIGDMFTSSTSPATNNSNNTTDWMNNYLSSDLNTPIPSPSFSSGSSPNKRRKK